MHIDHKEREEVTLPAHATASRGREPERTVPVLPSQTNLSEVAAVAAEAAVKELAKKEKEKPSVTLLIAIFTSTIAALSLALTAWNSHTLARVQSEEKRGATMLAVDQFVENQDNLLASIDQAIAEAIAVQYPDGGHFALVRKHVAEMRADFNHMLQQENAFAPPGDVPTAQGMLSDIGWLAARSTRISGKLRADLPALLDPAASPDEKKQKLSHIQNYLQSLEK